MSRDVGALLTRKRSRLEVAIDLEFEYGRARLNNTIEDAFQIVRRETWVNGESVDAWLDWEFAALRERLNRSFGQQRRWATSRRERYTVGQVITKRDGSRWRVDCISGGTLGLSPVGVWHRLYWALRLRGWL